MWRRKHRFPCPDSNARANDDTSKPFWRCGELHTCCRSLEWDQSVLCRRCAGWSQSKCYVDNRTGNHHGDGIIHRAKLSDDRYDHRYKRCESRNQRECLHCRYCARAIASGTYFCYRHLSHTDELGRDGAVRSNSPAVGSFAKRHMVRISRHDYAIRSIDRAIRDRKYKPHCHGYCCKHNHSRELYSRRGCSAARARRDWRNGHLPNADFFRSDESMHGERFPFDRRANCDME